MGGQRGRPLPTPPVASLNQVCQDTRAFTSRGVNLTSSGHAALIPTDEDRLTRAGTGRRSGRGPCSTPGAERRFSFLGRDFSHDETLDVPTQVELLIKQATSHENLCQCYIGW